MRKTLLVFAAAMALVVGGAGQAQALSITPATGCVFDPVTCDPATRWEGNESSQAQIDAIIGPILGLSTELYKMDAPSTESGSLQDSYSTVLGTNTATISYVSGNIVGPTAFLLVKDGSAVPNWYLFNLTAIFGWNGMEILELSGFFPGPGNEGGGAISHVTLYGTALTDGGDSDGVTPEPAMLALFGTALAIVGARLRRRR